jgi:hypothetical protein
MGNINAYANKTSLIVQAPNQNESIYLVSSSFQNTKHLTSMLVLGSP